MDVAIARRKFFENPTEENKLKVLDAVEYSRNVIIIEQKKIEDGGRSLFTKYAILEMLFFLHIVVAEVNSGVTAVFRSITIH
jgi:hypothetical protein